jgi:hypothetical protein
MATYKILKRSDVRCPKCFALAFEMPKESGRVTCECGLTYTYQLMNNQFNMAGNDDAPFIFNEIPESL